MEGHKDKDEEEEESHRGSVAECLGGKVEVNLVCSIADFLYNPKLGY